MTRILSRTGLHMLNAVWLFFVLFPISAMVFAAFQSQLDLQSNIHNVIPNALTLDNFWLILSQGEGKGSSYTFEEYLPSTIRAFYLAFMNSLVIAIAVTFLTLMAGSFSAYVAVRYRAKWTIVLLQLNVFSRFVPVFVLMIPLYIVFRQFGMLNTLYGVIVAKTGFMLPFAILLLTSYFETIPRELEEAARIDGCSRFTAFVRIVLPISAPGLAATGSIVFIASWHELLIPLILNSKVEMMTLPALLGAMVGDTQVFFNLIMATALLAVLPTVVIVLLLRKYVVAGLSAGALKG